MRLLSILTGISALVYLSGCQSGHTEEKKEETIFLATTPLQTDTSLIRDYVAQIKAWQHIELRAMEGGFLQKIYVDEGQSVRKGQVLFQILPNIHSAEVEKAKAEVELAQIEYNNTKKLTDSDVVSPNELAMAKARLDKAKAELNLMQTHLDFTTIRAPFDGIIDRFLVRQGSLLEEGELLTSMSDNSKMWVYFNVPEAEYLDYKLKKQDGPQQVQLMLANRQIFDQTGKVETIEADFNNETGNIAFRAGFANPQGILRHGETGNVRMQMAMSNALLVPQKATFETLDKRYVFVIDKDKRVKTRQITVAAELEDLFVISEGLLPTDHILLEGLRKVQENDKINYRLEAPAKVIGHLKVHAE